MDQDNEQSICSSPNAQFLSESMNQELGVAEQVGVNELSSDSSEQNCNKPENDKASRRQRPDSVRQNRKLKVKNDTSHRDIEKRRRDRINRSLWMLKDLVPAAKNRYGSKSGRLEKAEVLELTVEYLRLLNKGNGVESPLSVITPLKSKEDPDQESQSGELSLPQDLYIAGFKDGVLEVLNQLKRNAFLSDFQARDIVSRVNARDRDGNLFNIAKATGVMDALGLAYDVDNNSNKMSDTEKQNMDFQTARDICRNKPTDVDSGYQGMSDDDRIRTGPSQYLMSRKRRQTAVDSYESDSLSSDNSSERSCMHLLSPKRPFKSSSDESGNEKGKNFEVDQRFPSEFENFVRNSPLVASSGSPILFPAYALHASGTRYVPVVIPPSALFNPSQLATYTSESGRHPDSYSKRRKDFAGLGQPPVLIRNGESYPNSSDKFPFSRNGYQHMSDQEHQQSLSSAPTSVISVGKTSDSYSDDETERNQRPVSVVTTSASHDSSSPTLSARGRLGYESEPVDSLSKEYSRSNVDTKFKGSDRRHSINSFDYQSHITDHFQHFSEGQGVVPSNSVLQYLQDKYSYKGFYR